MTHAPLTVLADENIANLDDYLTHHPVRIIRLKGRSIDQTAIDTHRPDALFIRSVTPITPDTIGDFGKVRFIGSATIGTDHVDGEHLSAHGIAFGNASGCSKHSVAQYVITAILSLRPEYCGERIRLGIIGLGNIGGTLAKYAKDLGWQALGFDPFLPASKTNNSTLDELLSCSDVVSIHTPLTKDGKHPTHQLFDKTSLSALQDGTLLINTARGEIIHQTDLLHAIDKQNLQVVLDVFPHEPNVDQALIDRLAIATPHIAGYTLEGKLRGTDIIYQDFCRHFKLPIMQQLDPLLPPNPLSWTGFVEGVKNDTKGTLAHFYDIKKDDAALRAVSQDGVLPHDFDALRKNYALRREWLY